VVTFRLVLCFALLVVCLLAGCTRNPLAPAQIRGTVTYKGSPVPAGTVSFHSPDKGTYSGPLNADGTYEIRDVPTGTLVVTVETETINPKNKPKMFGGAKGAKQYAERLAAEGKAASEKTPPQPYVAIPKNYGAAAKSPLKVTVDAGRQSHDFTLTD